MSDDPVQVEKRKAGRWWVAALVAIVAVVAVIAFLSDGGMSAAKRQAAHDQSRAEAQTDDAAYGAQLAAAHAAQFTQAAQAGHANATETAAQAGAASAGAAAQDAAATVPAAAPAPKDD